MHPIEELSGRMIDTLDMGRAGVIIEREISMRKTAEIERLTAELAAERAAKRVAERRADALSGRRDSLATVLKDSHEAKQFLAGRFGAHLLGSSFSGLAVSLVCRMEEMGRENRRHYAELAAERSARKAAERECDKLAHAMGSLRPALAEQPPVEPAAETNLRESLEALREAGGYAWDDVADPEEYPGRKDEPAADPGGGELLPCPFCGRHPRLTDRCASPSERSPTKRIYFLACMCDGYSATAHQFGYSLEEVAGKWNRRASPPPRPATAGRREGAAKAAYVRHANDMMANGSLVGGSWEWLSDAVRAYWRRIADAVLAAVEPPRPAAIVQVAWNVGETSTHAFEDVADARQFARCQTVAEMIHINNWTWHPATAVPPAEPAARGDRP